MSMIFQFRMLSDENDNFVRGYEVLYDMNLADLHKFISGDLGYDPDQMTSFFTSNKQWEKLSEYTLLEMGFDGNMAGGVPRAMSDVAVGQIIHKKFDRLIYLFDQIGDRALFLELVGAVKQEDGGQYPKVVLSEGAAPGQFGPEEDSGGGSIFDDAMSDFNGFEGDDSYEDEF